MKRLPLAILLLSTLLAGVACFSLTRPYKEVSYYDIQYEPPQPEGVSLKNIVVRISNFNVAPPFDQLKILYSTSMLKLKPYEYNVWIANPGDMLSDLLMRDMIASGFYMAVIDMKSSIIPQYELEGTVEQIYEKDEGSEWYSVLSIRCVFFAYCQGKKVLFQRVYRQEIKTAGHDPSDIVNAMGQAAKAISSAIQKDMNEAVMSFENVKKEKEQQEKNLSSLHEK